MKVGDLVKVSILDEKELAIIIEGTGCYRWNGRLHEHIKTWQVMFNDGSISDEFEIDLRLVDESQ